MMDYFPGMAVGLILMQTAIVAPSLFRTLELDSFGKSIRDIWPKFFLALGAIGVLSIISVYLDQSSKDIHFVLAGITVSLSLMCYLIIPATNRATDNGDHRKFNILHKLSVYSTLAILISNLVFIAV
tara:strand:- start:209 stop:589 length:381 start_codon:yes stop_codon:yes gene_type:complete